MNEYVAHVKFIDMRDNTYTTFVDRFSVLKINLAIGYILERTMLRERSGFQFVKVTSVTKNGVELEDFIGNL